MRTLTNENLRPSTVDGKAEKVFFPVINFAKTIVTLFKANRTNGQAFESKPRECERKGSDTSFLELIRDRIEYLKAMKRYATAANYTSALNSIKSFADGKDVTLEMITTEEMERYEAWLNDRGLKRNSTSFYMRILRAVYNVAVKDGLIEQTYPFANVYTGTDRTRKRAISEEMICEIAKLNLNDNLELKKSQDFFILSYCLCGMPFVDMANLKPKNIKDGEVSYERCKTSEPIMFKLPQLAETIIKRYEQKDSPYVLPIITSTDSEEAHRQYRTALVKHNRNLHAIGKILNSDVCLTSYVARHSWATSARNHGYPASAIGAALGHTDERTTLTYLASINNDVIDKMNKDVLGCLEASLSM